MKKLFLDMDGVIADFVGGICAAHGRPSPYPEAAGCFDIEIPWGISKEEFWAPGNSFEFWYNLDPTPEAEEIVKLAIDCVGEKNVCILTAPNQTPGCIPAKQGWIRNYFPMFEDRIIYAKSKEFIGGPNRILVDDKDSNIDRFIAVGGEGILVPRLWNRDWPLADHTLDIIKERFETINSKCVSA